MESATSIFALPPTIPEKPVESAPYTVDREAGPAYKKEPPKREPRGHPFWVPPATTKDWEWPPRACLAAEVVKKSLLAAFRSGGLQPGIIVSTTCPPKGGLYERRGRFFHTFAGKGLGTNPECRMKSME